MQTNDVINGVFELMGGAFNVINIRRLVRDKKLSGVSWVPTIYFTAWGAWNLYYYPMLNQVFSFIGGLSIFISNMVWISLVFYYGRKSNQ